MMFTKHNQQRDDSPFPPAEERIHENVWALDAGGRTVLSDVNYYASSDRAQELLSHDDRNICIYPQDEVQAIEAYFHDEHHRSQRERNGPSVRYGKYDLDWRHRPDQFVLRDCEVAFRARGRCQPHRTGAAQIRRIGTLLEGEG